MPASTFKFIPIFQSSDILSDPVQPQVRQRRCIVTGQLLARENLQRATVCIWSDAPEEKAEFERWLLRWKDRMAFVSNDYGCGCCVHLYDIEGRKEGIDALPKKLCTPSRWTEGA